MKDNVETPIETVDFGMDKLLGLDVCLLGKHHSAHPLDSHRICVCRFTSILLYFYTARVNGS